MLKPKRDDQHYEPDRAAQAIEDEASMKACRFCQKEAAPSRSLHLATHQEKLKGRATGGGKKK